jgi:hypothetical protein
MRKLPEVVIVPPVGATYAASTADELNFTLLDILQAPILKNDII